MTMWYGGDYKCSALKPHEQHKCVHTHRHVKNVVICIVYIWTKLPKYNWHHKKSITEIVFDYA